MTELQNGNIGVGTETPTVLFDISGNTKISGDLNTIGPLQMNGQTQLIVIKSTTKWCYCFNGYTL